MMMMMIMIMMIMMMMTFFGYLLQFIPKTIMNSQAKHSLILNDDGWMDG